MIMSNIEFEVSFKNVTVKGYLMDNDLIFYDYSMSNTYKNQAPPNHYRGGEKNWFDYNRLMKMVLNDTELINMINQQDQQKTIKRGLYSLTVNP